MSLYNKVAPWLAGIVLLLGGCAANDTRTERSRHEHADPATTDSVTSESPHRHVENAEPDFVPGRVKSAFTREFHGATINDVEKRTHPDGTVHWEFDFKTKDGAHGIAEFDDDGKRVR